MRRDHIIIYLSFMNKCAQNFDKPTHIHNKYYLQRWVGSKSMVICDIKREEHV